MHEVSADNSDGFVGHAVGAGVACAVVPTQAKTTNGSAERRQRWLCCYMVWAQDGSF